MVVYIHAGPLCNRVHVTQLVLFQWLLTQPSVYHLVLSWPRHVLLLSPLTLILSLLLIPQLLRLRHYWVPHERVKIRRTWVVCVHVCLCVLLCLKRLVRSEFWLFFLLCYHCCNHVWPRPWSLVTVVLTCVYKIGFIWYDGFCLFGGVWPFHG